MQPVARVMLSVWFDLVPQAASILGRVVKALDLRPNGRSPREFEPRRMQCFETGKRSILYWQRVAFCLYAS